MRRPSAPATERDVRSLRTHRAGTLVAIVLAMVLTACAGDDETVDPAEVESLREQVTALTERGAARAQRLEELEATTDRLTRTNPVTRVTEAEREIARLDDTLAVLDEDLAEQNAAILEVEEQLQGTVGELRGQLDSALERIDRVSGQIEDLEIRYLTLRDRLDRVSP